jgi:hypothetical protein
MPNKSLYLNDESYHIITLLKNEGVNISNFLENAIIEAYNRIKATKDKEIQQPQELNNRDAKLTYLIEHSTNKISAKEYFNKKTDAELDDIIKRFKATL